MTLLEVKRAGEEHDFGIGERPFLGKFVSVQQLHSMYLRTPQNVEKQANHVEEISQIPEILVSRKPPSKW